MRLFELFEIESVLGCLGCLSCFVGFVDDRALECGRLSCLSRFGLFELFWAFGAGSVLKSSAWVRSSVLHGMVPHGMTELHGTIYSTLQGHEAVNVAAVVAVSAAAAAAAAVAVSAAVVAAAAAAAAAAAVAVAPWTCGCEVCKVC